jgi:hypothetical protein
VDACARRIGGKVNQKVRKGRQPGADKSGKIAKVVASRAQAAKENKIESGKATGRGHKNPSPILAEGLDTLKDAAKEAGVSHGTISARRW